MQSDRVIRFALLLLLRVPKVCVCVCARARAKALELMYMRSRAERSNVLSGGANFNWSLHRRSQGKEQRPQRMVPALRLSRVTKAWVGDSKELGGECCQKKARSCISTGQWQGWVVAGAVEIRAAG